MYLRRRAGEPAVADVELEIIQDDRFVPLAGIVVREPRGRLGDVGNPAFGNLGICPPLAHPRAARERIESPEFYKLIQEQATRRYLATKAKAP